MDKETGKETEVELPPRCPECNDLMKVGQNARDFIVWMCNHCEEYLLDEKATRELWNLT